MPGLVLFIPAFIFFFIGGIVFLTSMSNRRRRKRILDTPTSPIAQAPGQGWVEIKGRILPSEQGLIQSPFSGRPAVWARITVQELRSSGKSSHWITIITETAFRPFMVDDGSGQYARIEPQGANVVLDSSCVNTSGTFRDPPPHVQHFLASRGRSHETWLGFNKSMRYSEEVLAPGDALFALGPSWRQAGPPVNDGYRMVPSTQLVLANGQGPDNELILTNKSEQELVSRLNHGFIASIVLFCIGGFFALGGVVGFIASLL